MPHNLPNVLMDVGHISRKMWWQVMPHNLTHVPILVVVGKRVHARYKNFAYIRNIPIKYHEIVLVN